MPKRAFFESAKHHLLLQAKNIANQERLIDPHAYRTWKLWVNSFTFIYVDPDTIKITWDFPKKGSDTISIKKVQYYSRGDTPKFVEEQEHHHQLFHDDKVRAANDKLFQSLVIQLAKKARIPLPTARNKRTAIDIARIHDEEELSDHWAEGVDPASIDVIHTNTALTSPELRYLHQRIGDIKGKSVLDLGCGLGEVSVYFALQGADVTAVDLSQPMLDVVQQVAKRYKVKLKTVQASVEELDNLKKHSFDIIYVGNLFHHVNIPKTLKHVTRVLKPSGQLICWEPVDYNPVINVYRKIANNVRSYDERPFRMSDIELFKQTFKTVEIRWAWFSTLFVFVYMALVQRRDPNKERYWKVVIKESEKWRPLYAPLEKFDRFILKTFPALGPLCWNVILVCSGVKKN